MQVNAELDHQKRIVLRFSSLSAEETFFLGCLTISLIKNRVPIEGWGDPAHELCIRFDALDAFHAASQDPALPFPPVAAKGAAH
jgi:hypothetical protein